MFNLFSLFSLDAMQSVVFSAHFIMSQPHKSYEKMNIRFLSKVILNFLWHFTFHFYCKLKASRSTISNIFVLSLSLASHSLICCDSILNGSQRRNQITPRYSTTDPHQGRKSRTPKQFMKMLKTVWKQMAVANA